MVCSSMPSTVPEVGAWTVVLSGSSGTPMGWPLRTCCPASTMQRVVARALRRSGTNSRGGIGAGRIGAWADSFLWVSGLTPPLKVNSPAIMPLPRS